MKVGSRKIISVHSNNCKLLPNRQQLLRFNDLSGRLNSPSTTTSDKNSSNNNTPDPFHYSTSLARNLNNLPPSGGAANNQNLPSPDHPLTPPDPPSDEEFYTGSDDSAPDMERSYDPDDTILGYQDQGSPDTTDPEIHNSPTAPPKPANVPAPEAGASTSGAMTRTRAKREQFIPEQPEYSKTSLEFNLNKKRKRGS